MSSYDRKSILSVLKYIKETQSLDLFAASGRLSAMIGDLAPGLVKERKMIDRMDKLGIINEFVQETNSNDTVKRRVISKAVERLTAEELIQEKAAEEYAYIVAKALDWNVSKPHKRNSKKERTAPVATQPANNTTSVKKATTSKKGGGKAIRWLIALAIIGLIVYLNHERIYHWINTGAANIGIIPQNTQGNVGKNSGSDSELPTGLTATPSPIPESATPTQERIMLKDIEWSKASSEAGGFRYFDEVIDNQGQTYDNGIGGSDGHGMTFQEYTLNGEFTEIIGRVVLNYKLREKESLYMKLFIYGDGKLLFRSQPVSAGCEPQDFSVDISGVEVLRLEIIGKDMLRLVDCFLIK